MLEDLSVRDFALIESVSLDFEKGLNILSGETGAGKSILIGSLTFLLGGKAGPDSIRTGAEEAWVSGSVLLEPNCAQARKWLADRGIETEDERVLLRRTIKTNGKSGTWVQNTQVTRAELAEFTSFLVDIHGQHDHQSLLKVDEHRRFLDSYAGIEAEVAAFTALYGALADKRAERDELNASDTDRAQRIELLTFAIDEIRKASLKAGEEAELEAEEGRLSQHEKLCALVEQAVGALSAPEGALSALKKARVALDGASAVDSGLSPALNRVETGFYELEDVAETVRQYLDSLTFDPKRLEAIEDRLSLIYKLKKKYGTTVEEVIAHADRAEAELERLSQWETNRATIDAEIAELERKLHGAGNSITAKRKAASQTLESGVEEILATLGMTGTRFSVGITPREATDTARNCGPYGFESVEFLISANPGEPLKPLAKIASGGEISRVMLALKTVLADADESGTLIFDEIDTGIGGEVALSVGGHLKKLSKRKQILCITHLASIAVRADNQIKIEKTTESGKTITRAFGVSGAKRTEEIARMLAGDGFSAASMQHAEELLTKYAT